MKLTKAQRETAEDNGIPLSRVRQRIHQGWDVEKATTTPVRHKKKTHGGMAVGDVFITAEQLEIGESNGLNRDMIRHRVYRGMRVVDAITVEKYTPEIKKHYTAADKKLASDNGVSMDCVHQRVKRGWGKDKALTTPPIKKVADARTEHREALETIGRIKYLNKHDFKDAPIAFPKTEIKKIKEMGLSINDVEEIEV